MTMTAKSGTTGYRIDDVTLDIDRRHVTRRGDPIQLGKLTYDLLVALAEAAPAVVTQEELGERLWSGRYVNPETIKQRVKLLRQALSDDARQPRYIEVIRGQGYRLIPDVGILTGETSSPTWRLPAFAAAIAAVIGFAVLLGTFWTAQSPSIAVMPFTDMSPDGDQEHFGDGIAEQLLTELAGLDGLAVAGRTSSFSFKRSEEDLQTIGEALGVSHILSGSVRKDVDQIRITARLNTAADGLQVWEDTFDRELADIFAIQDEISAAVAGALGVRLGVGGVNAFRGAGTRNVDAYEAYLKGSVLPLSSDEAAALFESATIEDPNYAAAWARRGLAKIATMWTTLPEEAPKIVADARVLLDRAVDLDPQSAEANSLLGTSRYTGLDWIGGEEAHARSLSLLRNRSHLRQHGAQLVRTGRTAAALTVFSEAESVEPQYGRHEMTWLVEINLTKGQYPDARAAAESGHRQGARDDIDLLISLNKGDSTALKASMMSLPDSSLSTTALYSPVLNAFHSPALVLTVLQDLYNDESVQWPSKLHEIALLAAFFGYPDFALKVKAQEVRDTQLRLYALWYPVMSGARQLPEFKELVTDIKLVAYWRTYGWADFCSPLGDDDFFCS